MEVNQMFRGVEMTLKVEKGQVLQALLSLPDKELEEMLEKIRAFSRVKAEALSILDPSELDPLEGAIKLGGDALADTERCYE